MRFPALKLRERIEMRIRVTKRDHETGVNARLGRVVEKAAALGRVVERPTERVHDFTRPVQRWIDLPDLLEAEPKMRRIRIGAQREMLLETAADKPAATLREHHTARAQLVTGLEFGLVSAVARDTEIPRHHAGHATVVDQKVRRRVA